MEEPLDGGVEEEAFGELKGVRAINFTFDVDEVTEQIKTEDAVQKAKARKELLEKQTKKMQKPGAWNIAGSACEAWDWFQGRARDTFDYTTFRHRKYGYLVQLYDQTNGAWISFSRMAKTQVVYVCFSNGLTETRKEFWGNDLVQSLVNLTVVQNRSMPFRAIADGDPVIFRHSYWHGQVQGGSVVIKHLKKTKLELHLTPEGFVFVGEPSYLQGGEGEMWTEIEDDVIKEDPVPRLVDESLGPPLAIWVQGPKRAQKVAVDRAVDLLKEQDLKWRQGDTEWMYIAREAKLENATKDAAMGVSQVNTLDTTADEIQEFYNHRHGVPYAELEGIPPGGGAGEPPPLEELVYQEGVGFGFNLL